MLRKAAIPLLLLSLAAGLLVSGDSLAAAFYRNLGHLPLLGGPGPCSGGVASPPVRYLEQAVRRQGNSAAAWRTLLRVKGWSDRQWIRDALGESPPGWVEPGALRQAAEALRPSGWAMQQPWTEERCRAAWDAWTLGLVWALDGRRSEAVAAYQAGLGLAPGRAPAEVVQEYYLALARHTLAVGEAAPAGPLAAAKYLALGGDGIEAAQRLRDLLGSGALDAGKTCEAERWLGWVRDGGPAPGPGICGSAGADAGRVPGWVLPPASAVAGETAGQAIWGFDLDPDVLEAGAEVLGTFYWRAPGGQVEIEDFRQANLWPNSGNSWLRLEGFSSCLPGYAEPAWVSPCASDVADGPAQGGSPNPVGHLAVPSAEGPDILLQTASAMIPSDRPIIYGGWWRRIGELPQAHVARYGEDRSDPRAYYEKVIELGDLPEGVWSSRAGISPGLPWAKEFRGWIRPETDVGQGDLLFDGLFCFPEPGLE